MNKRLTYPQAIQAAATLLASEKVSARAVDDDKQAELVSDLFALADRIYHASIGFSTDEELGF
ncbi:hypothetical protein AM305_07763 [Actinobacillus minor NM305]|uniref:Uncharacterized protein n=2 Tax=Actinobacillus minor TaxID=51047 RepID=C5S0X7_9PAST|nr:hypothetical protein [Actinobacillus minor]EER47560.1 hypothetical protein AM305_07763 [Actinobacillus minor NM305]MCT8823511.1 hypothetical protein [Glaesserella parasuis]MDY4713253.1 hypothetical protein [Actinobacillus minor]